MTWLLSLLGIGGIGAALFLIPGLLPRAIEAAGALLGVVRRNPWPVAVIALCALSAAFWHGGNVARSERNDARLQIVLWQDAQAAATVWAKAEAARKDALASDITKGANDVRNQAASLRAGNEFALSHRCLRVTPASGGERADLSGAVPVAGQPANEADAALVAVARPDFDAATVNSADLLNAYQWGQAMIAAGLAK